MSVGPSLPKYLVHHDVVAVVAVAGYGISCRQLARQRFVERPCSRLAAKRTAGHTDDVVLDIVSERSQDSVDVGTRLHREVLLDHPIQILTRNHSISWSHIAQDVLGRVPMP